MRTCILTRCSKGYICTLNCEKHQPNSSFRKVKCNIVAKGQQQSMGGRGGGVALQGLGMDAITTSFQLLLLKTHSVLPATLAAPSAKGPYDLGNIREGMRVVATGQGGANVSSDTEEASPQKLRQNVWLRIRSVCQGAAAD